MGKKVRRFFGARLKKVRGWKKKHRCEVRISEITNEGFRLRTFNRDYYVPRNIYHWFKNATHRQIQDVVLVPCVHNDPADDWQFIDDSYPAGHNPPPEGYPDHGDHLRWESLDVDLGTNDFEYPDRIEGGESLKIHPNQKRRVKVSDITSKGFRVQVLGREYYLEREKYDALLHASDAEIANVYCFGGEYLEWKTLGLVLCFDALDGAQ